MKIGKVLATLRKKRGLTQDQMAEILNVKRARYNSWENDIAKSSIEMLDKIAEHFNISTDYLLGRTDDPDGRPYYALTPKDEKDIAKELEKIMADLESEESLSFYNEPMDEETKRLMQISLENSLRVAKEMAKKKFTPKKYRD